MRDNMFEFEGRVDDWRVFSRTLAVSKIAVMAVGLAFEARRRSWQVWLTWWRERPALGDVRCRDVTPGSRMRSA
jgi:hypothetical protein